MKYIIITIFISFFISCKGKVDTSPETLSVGSFQLLADNELKSKSLEELKLIRNEVFARKGYIFKDQELNDYYSNKKWYNPNPNTKVELTPEEEGYISKIKNLEANIKTKKPLNNLQAIDLEKERKSLESKGLKIVNEVKGFYNDDSITDVVWVINKVTKPEDGGYPKMEYWLHVFLGTSITTEYKLLFKLNKVIPCNNCYNWDNEADYSFFNVKLEAQIFSFSTNQVENNSNGGGYSQRNTFVFKYKNGNMVLNEVIKKHRIYSTDKQESDVIKDLKKVHLQDFNVYDWKYVDPAYISG